MEGTRYYLLNGMETKDAIAIAGIGVTLVVSSANLAYSLWSNKRSSFVNTVTTSRLKWIDSPAIKSLSSWPQLSG